MWSRLLQPCQSPKSLELISKPCPALITNGSRQSRSVQSTSAHRGRPNGLQQTLSTHWVKEAQKCFAHQYCDQNKHRVTQITLWSWSFGDCTSLAAQWDSKLRSPDWHWEAQNTEVNVCSSSLLSASRASDKQVPADRFVSNTLKWGLQRGPNSWCQLLW